MKILYVLTTKFEISGITNSVMDYYRHMDKHSLKIDFVTPNRVVPRIRNEINNNGGCLFELPMRRSNPFKYMHELKTILTKGKYDIVHAHGNSCTLALEMYTAKQAGTKIRIAHSRNTTCKYKLIHRILRPVFNRSYTHGFACGIEAGKWLFENNDFVVINNGKDLNRFKFDINVRREYRNKYALTGRKVIGHTGFFNYQKNHEYLVRILNELVKIDKRYFLIAVGDGCLKRSIENLIKDMGLCDHVIFTGYSLEVEKLLQAMDIMVFPSRFEGLPNTLIEAQIACLPSVVSDRVTKEVKITDLVNFMSLDVDPKTWAKEICKIEPVNREIMGNKILRQVTDAGFNIKENAKALKRLYVDLISEYEQQHSL